jgi:hypothetical protein
LEQLELAAEVLLPLPKRNIGHAVLDPRKHFCFRHIGGGRRVQGVYTRSLGPQVLPQIPA